MSTSGKGSTSKPMIIIGFLISVLPALALVLSSIMKLTRHPQVVKGFSDLGYPSNLIMPLGILELSCALIYLFPRTAGLGAILMTGYLGGAIATHVRLGQPFYLQAGLGVLVWLGLYFRDARVRALIPLRA